MGRFYKTAKPEMMDFMFKVPEQAIMTAIKGADAQLEGQEGYLTDLQKQLKTAALDPDEEKRKARVTELEGKIREHSLKIWENPLLAIKEQKGIRDLGQEIYKDLTEGELYAYNTNAQKRAAYQEEQMKRATQKDGSIRVQDVDKAMANYDLQYKLNQGAQFNKETGKFNPYGTQNIVNYFDNMKYAEDIASKMRTHKNDEWKVSKEGMNWFKTTENYNILNLDEGTAGTYSMMMMNKELTDRVDYDIRTEALSRALNQNRMGELKLIEDEVRTDYYGERDKTTDELILVPVLNEDGTPKKEKVTVKDASGKEKVVEKPVMEPKKEGLLLQQARAAADMYDIHDTQIGKDYLGGDQGDLASLNSRLRKQEEEHKKLLDAPTLVDSKSSSTSKAVLAGTTHAEVEANLKASKDRLDQKKEAITSDILGGLGKIGAATTTNFNKIQNEIRSFLTGDNPDWKGLHNYLSQYKGLVLSNGNKIGTGIQDYQNDWIKSSAEYTNQKTFYDKLIADADKEIDPSLSTQAVNNVKARLDNNTELLRASEQLLKEYDANPNDPKFHNFNEYQVAQDIIKYKVDIAMDTNEYARRKKERDDALDKIVNFNTNTIGSKNRIVSTHTTIRGKAWENYGANDQEKLQWTNALKTIKNLGAHNFRNSTKSKMLVDGVLQDFNINKLIGTVFKAEDVKSHEVDVLGNIIVKTNDGEFKFTLDDVGIAQANIQGVGRSPWEYRMSATNPKTKNLEYITIYQPFEETSTNISNTLSQNFAADNSYEIFINEAQAMEKSGVDYIDSQPETRGKVRYLTGTQDVEITLSDGTKKVAKYNSKEMKQLYKDIYNAKPGY
jgi:hypothetical protein